MKQQSHKEEYIDDSLKPRSRPSSGRRSQIPSSSDDAVLTFDETLKQRSRPSSGRRSHTGTPELMEDKHHKRPSSGRRSQSSTPDITEDGDKNKKELDLLFDLNAMPRRFAKNQNVLDSMDVHKVNINTFYNLYLHTIQTI